MAMSRSFFLTSRSILETVAVVRLVIGGRSTLLRLGLDPLEIDENKKTLIILLFHRSKYTVYVIIFLPISLNMCFKYPQHMFGLRKKEINF